MASVQPAGAEADEIAAPAAGTAGVAVAGVAAATGATAATGGAGVVGEADTSWAHSRTCHTPAKITAFFCRKNITDQVP